MRKKLRKRRWVRQENESAILLLINYRLKIFELRG